MTVWLLGERQRLLVVVGWVALNVALLAMPLTYTLLQPPQPGIWHDYLIWAQVAERLDAGTLYD
jgi:hypothetical protein